MKPEDETPAVAPPFERGVGPLVERLEDWASFDYEIQAGELPAIQADCRLAAAEIHGLQESYGQLLAENVRLRSALAEAMQQATEYDGLDVAKVGPQHWYTKAADALRPNVPGEPGA